MVCHDLVPWYSCRYKPIKKLPSTVIQDPAVHGQAIEDRSNCILHLRIPRLKLLDWRYCPHRKYVYYIYNQRKSQIPIYKNVYVYNIYIFIPVYHCNICHAFLQCSHVLGQGLQALAFWWLGRAFEDSSICE